VSVVCKVNHGDRSYGQIIWRIRNTRLARFPCLSGTCLYYTIYQQSFRICSPQKL